MRPPCWGPCGKAARGSSGSDAHALSLNNPVPPRVPHAMKCLLLFFTLVITLSVSAETLTPDQFAAEARGCRERARDVLQVHDDLVTRFAQHARYVRAEMPKIKAAYDKSAGLWNQTADAYDEQDAS